MKKFLALALTLALALSISVFAVETERIVGTKTDPATIDNGVTYANFGDGEGEKETTIAITVETALVESRYAVDVEFEALSLNITRGKLIWNVNTYEYDMPVGGDVDDLDTTKELKVINHSDKPVYVKGVINKENPGDGINIAITGEEKVERTQAGVGIGNANFNIYTVSITSTDWNAVADFYASALSTANSVEVAQVKLTVSRDPFPPVTP